MSALLAAVDVLNVRVVAAGAIGDSLDLVAGDAPPPWVFVYRDQIENIREAAEVLETLIRRGIGVVDPDGGTEVALKHDQTRDGSQPANPSPSRPEKQTLCPQTSNQVTKAVDTGAAAVHNVGR